MSLTKKVARNEIVADGWLKGKAKAIGTKIHTKEGGRIRKKREEQQSKFLEAIIFTSLHKTFVLCTLF